MIIPPRLLTFAFFSVSKARLIENKYFVAGFAFVGAFYRQRKKISQYGKDNGATFNERVHSIEFFSYIVTIFMFSFKIK